MMGERFDADRAIHELQQCQDILYDYSLKIKDDDYLKLCNGLQYAFFEIQQMKQHHHGMYVRLHDMSSEECIIFLLNVIKYIMWSYSIVVLVFTFYLIIDYRDKIIMSRIFKDH